MPTQSAQQSAVQAAQDLADLMALAKQLRDKGAAFVTRYNSEQYANVWGAMATAAPNGDGSLGAADGTPNAAHPIAVGGIYRSKNQLVAAVVLLQQFANFCGNAGVVQGNYSQSIDDLAS